MSDARDRGFYVDLPQTSDEVLVLLVKEARSQPARDELVLRYWSEVKSVISSLVRSRLPREDVEDAHQQAFFWIEEAIHAYDTFRLPTTRGSSFRTFLHRVVGFRTANFIRNQRRFQEHFHAGCAAAELLENRCAAAQLPAEQALCSSRNDSALLLSVIRTLHPPERLLAKAISQGRRLCDIATAMRISYRTVQRHWRKLRADLVSALGVLRDNRPNSHSLSRHSHRIAEGKSSASEIAHGNPNRTGARDSCEKTGPPRLAEDPVTDSASRPQPPRLPHAEYTQRLQACRGRIADVSRREAFLGNLRFLYFVAVVGVLIYVASISGLVFVIVLIAALALFLLLGELHHRVLARLNRLERAAVYYERGLTRLEDRWMGGGKTGARYLDPEHPYSVDLDLFGSGSLYELLCTARTRRGEDTLAAWLQTPAAVAEVVSRQDVVRELAPRVALREQLALLGGDLPESADFHGLVRWAHDGLPPVQPRVRLILGWLAALPAAGILLWVLLGTPLPLIGFIAATGWFTNRLRPRVRAIADSVEGCAGDLPLLAGLLARLESEPFASPRLRQLQTALLTGGMRPSARIAELVRMIDWFNARYNPFFAPLGVMVLWTTQWALAIEAWRARVGPAFERWLDAVGQFETLAALSGYTYENPDDPFPELLPDGALFDGAALAHPLLPRSVAVRNDVVLGEAARVLVVSGSNMSGKSTLLRTVGANVVLALAGAPVRATRLRLSVLAVGATLRTQDSLQAGRSRFYAEIVRLRRLLDLTKRPWPLLFLLDEILHGTNSHDRRLGAEGVIRGFIARGAIGLVTTHDLALTQIVNMLAPHAANIHFADHFSNGQLTFDYRIRPGIAGHGNALDLMRSIGLDV